MTDENRFVLQAPAGSGPACVLRVERDETQVRHIGRVSSLRGECRVHVFSRADRHACSAGMSRAPDIASLHNVSSSHRRIVQLPHLRILRHLIV